LDEAAPPALALPLFFPLPADTFCALSGFGVLGGFGVLDGFGLLGGGEDCGVGPAGGSGGLFHTRLPS